MIISKELRLIPSTLHFFRAPLVRHGLTGHPHLKALAFCLLTLPLLLSPLSIAQSSEQQIESSFRAGQVALKQGDYHRAIEEFKKVLAVDPSLIEAQVNLGLAYQSLLDYDAAARYLAHALQVRPNLTNLNVIVGMDFIKLGSPEKAPAYLEHALKLDPSSSDAHQAMALYYLTQENSQGAAEQYRKVAELDPNKAEALFRIGHQYLDLAARLAYRGARLYPESPWGHRFLGDMLLERDRWEDAAHEYQKALAIDPQQPGLHALIGNSFLHAQKLHNAEIEFRQELQLHPYEEQAWLGLANIQLANGQTSALASVDAIWRQSPEFLKAQTDFLIVNITPQNAQACISALRDRSDGPAKHFLLSALYSSINELTSSERESASFRNDLSKWRPTSHASDPNPCKLHVYSQCIASLERTKPLSSTSYLTLGKAWFMLQQYQHAAENLARVHGEGNENSEASYWLERTYQALGAEAFAQLEASFPDSWRTHQLRAESYALRRDRDDAIREYQAALLLEPDEAELHEELGEFYLENRSDDDAQRELEKAVALDPSRTKTLYLLGRLYVLDNENDKAVPYLRRALQLQPNLNEASGLLGTAYVRMGQFADAVPRLEKAASLDHFGNIHYQLFQAYRKLGQPELAQKALARSQDIRRSSLERDQALVMGSAQLEPDAQ